MNALVAKIIQIINISKLSNNKICGVKRKMLKVIVQPI